MTVVNKNCRQYQVVHVLESISIGKSLSVVRAFFEGDPLDLSSKKEAEVSFFIAYNSNIEKYLKREIHFSEVGSPGLWYLPKEIRDLLLTEGFSSAITPENLELYEASAEHLFKKLEKGNFSVTEDDVFELSFYDHSIKCLNGDPLPVAIKIDYMDGFFDNSNFDLDLAVQILSKNKQIIPAEEKGPSRKKIENKSPVLKLQKIPYYNVDEERDSYLSFWFVPTKDQMKRIIEIKNNSKWPSSLATIVVRENFLGHDLEAAKIAKK